MRLFASSDPREPVVSGYGLTTANILYRLPDHPALLQSFVWQFHDVAPKHPRLEKFLAFWEREIEAVIHSVEIGHKLLVSRTEYRNAVFAGNIH